MHRILILVACTLLAACGGSVPAEGDIRNAFQQELPGLLELKDFDTEDPRNIGSAEQPVWVARTTATLALREPTFEIQTVEADVRLLKPVRSAGETFTTYGTVRSERAGNGWRHRFQSDGSSNPVLGRPRSDYGPDALVAGSDEARALLARIEEQRAQARIAEEARIAAEAAERQRREAAEAAKRQRIEAAVAKHGAGFAPRRLGDLVGTNERGLFLVTGSIAGKGDVWGTDEYACGSDFAKAVVHAGVLADGETGIVEVREIGERRYNLLGSPRNGVASRSDDRENQFCTVRLVERIPSA